MGFLKKNCSNCGKSVGLFRFEIKNGCLCNDCKNLFIKGMGISLTLEQIKERARIFEERKKELEEASNCFICNKKLNIINRLQLLSGQWICSVCRKKEIYNDEYIHLAYPEEKLKPTYVEVTYENEYKKKHTWAEGLIKSKSIIYNEKKNMDLQNGLEAIESAAFLMNQKRIDYLSVRGYFLAGVELLRSFNALNNYQYCKVIQIATNDYCNFVFNYDPYYQKFLKEILPVIESNPGILQKDIYGKINLDKNDVSYALYFAEIEGKIKREKEKSTYKLFVIANNQEE